MRNLPFSILLLAALAASRPSVDRADSQETLTEEGVTAAGSGRSGGDPVAKGAENVTAETPLENLAVAQPERDSGTNVALDAGNTAKADPARTSARITHIPSTLWGRWALVPADCEPGRSDAKGLLRIDDNRLYFYESRATLDRIIAASPSRFEASYGFSGEGSTWDAVQVLELSGGKLRRTATGDQPVDLTYSRCP